jgi:predicted DNA binding CopG/RHH family protein
MERGTKESRIFLRISEEEKAAWQREAELQGVKLSRLIRQIVNDAIRRPEKE